MHGRYGNQRETYQSSNKKSRMNLNYTPSVCLCFLLLDLLDLLKVGGLEKNKKPYSIISIPCIPQNGGEQLSVHPMVGSFQKIPNKTKIRKWSTQKITQPHRIQGNLRSLDWTSSRPVFSPWDSEFAPQRWLRTKDAKTTLLWNSSIEGSRDS